MGTAELLCVDVKYATSEIIDASEKHFEFL